MPRRARLDAPGTLQHVMVLDGAGLGYDYMDFESRVWGCDGGHSEAFRGLHPGNRQGNSKDGGGGLIGGAGVRLANVHLARGR